MKIVAVRHGVTELNQKELFNGRIDEPMLEAGKEQIRKVSLELPEGIKAIYTSPLIRAMQTAEIIGERFQLPSAVSEGLIEVDLGELNGKSFEEMEKQYGHEYRKEPYVRLQYDYRRFGGESVDNVRDRVRKAIAQIQNSHRDSSGPILLATHGGILRILEHDYNGKFIDDMANAQVITFEI